MFNPKYQISNQILTWLSDIAEIRGKIAQLPLLPVRETILRRQAVIKMAHSSTSIEGNTLSEAEVAKLASKEPIIAPAKDQLEINNYFAALDLVSQYAQKQDITKVEILALHKQVMSGLLPASKLGKTRETPVYIVNTIRGQPDKIVYTPPPAKEVDKLLAHLMRWHAESQNIHPVIRAGLLHYQFESNNLVTLSVRLGLSPRPGTRRVLQYRPPRLLPSPPGW
jgi:Fic family protein